MKKITLLIVAIIIINSCGNMAKKVFRYEAESVDNISDIYKDADFGLPDIENKYFNVYTIYDNGDKNAVETDIIGTKNEELAAKSIVEKIVSFAKASNYTYRTDELLAKEDQAIILKQHPDLFEMKTYMSGVEVTGVCIKNNSVPLILALLDKNFYHFPLKMESDILNKYLNNIFEKVHTDLDFGEITSKGDSFKVWTFLDKQDTSNGGLLGNEFGTKGYSIKVKKINDKLTFQYIGSDRYLLE